MRRLLFFLALAAGCGTETKTHCEATADCVDGDQCISGTCQGADHDACGVDHDQCAADATCANTDDALACTCAAGFTGDGMTCADVDECAVASTCAAHATCSNTPGAFTCACGAGYVGDGSYCLPLVFEKVAPAGGFTCALGGDGGIYCWGNNDYGDLGDGTSSPHARPVQVGTATDWIDVSARLYEACGLRADQSIWCWGWGENGQLGDGKLTTTSTPVEVVSDKPGVGWKSLSVGNQHACALHTDGSAACWGMDRTTSPWENVAKPVAVDANKDWTTISVGRVRCGLRDGGHLFCWGQGRYGDLGLGDVTVQATPAQVGTDTWRDVRVGHYNACAIRTDGALFCWGDHPLNDEDYGNTPTRIGTANDWQSISIASDSFVGLRTGGKAYSWGNNESGQLGQPLSTGNAEPSLLGNPTMTWSQIEAGNLHGCGIAGGQAYCWGTLGDGLLGDGQTTTLLSPTKLTDDKWTAIAIGDGGVRGLRSDGGLMTSGADLRFGVGVGSLEPIWSPVRIGSDRWDAVAVAHDGINGTCALRDGVPYCWGDNAFGRAGVGTVESPLLAPTAVKIPAGTRWTELATGYHTCGIRSDDQLFCWGRNDAGELGDGTSGNATLAPSDTPVGGTWNHVAVNGTATCAIASDHSLWCWGQDQPATPDVKHLVPTRIDLATDWDAIAMANAAEICAIKTTGTLWCWGRMSNAAEPEYRNTPKQVGAATDWKAIALGTARCGVKTDGTLWCWDNADALGDGSPIHYDRNGDYDSALEPTQIGTATDWKAVTTGSPQCGLKTDGTVLCWGRNAKPVTGILTTPVQVK